VLTASAGGDVDSGCMLLQVTQKFYPLCIGSAKVLTFFFCFFYGHFSTEKRKETKCGCLFRPKNKTPKNKKNAFSGAKKENKIWSASTVGVPCPSVAVVC